MQREAFAHPCFHAEETLDRRFHRTLELEGRLVSVTLTANIGEE